MTAAASTSKPPSTIMTMKDQASSWEVQGDSTAPTLQVALVYDSFKFADKCGHALPLLRLVREVLCASTLPGSSASVSSSSRKPLSSSTAATSSAAVCPICQTPIAYVTEVNKKDEPTVVFKYSKQIYRLTVPTVSAGGGDRSSSSSSSSPDERPWWQLLLGVGDSNERIRANTMTAQGRIAQVLGMSVDGGMKILSKGKVLYPNPLFNNSEISQQLIDQSPQDTGATGSSSSSSSSHKVALMVVGTVVGHELAPPPPTWKVPGISNDESRPWWQMVLGVGQTIFWQVWNWSWIILHKAMVATRQTLLGYVQPPAAPPAAGGRSVGGHESAPPTTTATAAQSANDASRPWWQMVLGVGQTIFWQVLNWSWIILSRAMVATRQTLLAYVHPPPAPPAGGRPEERARP